MPTRVPLVAASTVLVVAAGLVPAAANGAPPSSVRPTLTSVSTSVSTTAANMRLRRVVPGLLRAPALGRSVSVRISDLSGAAPYSTGSLIPRLPASNMKLVTAVTALRILGSSTRLPTRVVSGATSATAVLVGGGDPMLTSRDLRSLSVTTAASLVARLPAAPPPPGPTVTPPPPPVPVALRIALDDSVFATPTRAPGWTNAYVPSVVRPVRALVRDNRGGYDTSTDAARYLTGYVAKYVAAAVVARPDLAVSVNYVGRARASPAATPVATFPGHTVRESVAQMLLVSDNDIAEMLYRLSSVRARRGGTWTGGRATATAAMSALGVRVRELRLVDGSGVSRSDRLTTYALTTLLRVAVSPAHPELAGLRSMLPVAGRTGTLRARNGRFTTAPSKCARGLIQAKTGTLHDVIGLSGYAPGADGRLMVFSVLVNNRPERRFSALATRRAVDRIAATVTGCT